MADGSKTGGIALLAILALGGLGLSGYMFVEDRFLGGDEYVPDHDHEEYLTDDDLDGYVTEDDLDVYKLVGAWNELKGSGQTFNFTYGDCSLHQEEYFAMNTANDTFTLLQEGWYKLTILTTLINLVPSNSYRISVTKNGDIDHSQQFFASSSIFVLTFTYYVYSDGGDNIIVYGASSPNAFTPSTNQDYNAAYLEYLVA